VVLPLGAAGSPTVSQAAMLALHGPTEPAPPPDPADPTALSLRVQGMYFPDWAQGLGWRAVGERYDRLAGRPALTVFYESSGAIVGYTIVGAPALAAPSGPSSRRAGFVLRTFSLGGRSVVTWRRDDHTCVLSSRTASVSLLRDLAVWSAARTGP
jgi:hypothetical protein